MQQREEKDDEVNNSTIRGNQSLTDQIHSTENNKEKVVIYKGQETDQSGNKTIKGVIIDIF